MSCATSVPCGYRSRAPEKLAAISRARPGASPGPPQTSKPSAVAVCAVRGPTQKARRLRSGLRRAKARTAVSEVKIVPVTSDVVTSGVSQSVRISGEINTGQSAPNRARNWTANRTEASSGRVSRSGGRNRSKSPPGLYDDCPGVTSPLSITQRRSDGQSDYIPWAGEQL